MFSNLEILVGGCLFGFMAIAIIICLVTEKIKKHQYEKQCAKMKRKYSRAIKNNEYAEFVALASKYEKEL